MCTMSRDRSREFDGVGQARFQQLQRWVEADLRSGDSSLQTALRNWRNNVVGRVGPDRPQRIQIPQIFVERLGLPGQTVAIVDGDAVCLLSTQTRRKYELGSILIPRKGE